MKKATQILRGGGCAPATMHTVRRLEAIVKPRQAPPLPNQQWVREFQAQAEGIQQEDVVTTLKQAPKASAPDLLGWRYEFVQYLLADATSLEAFTRYLDLAAVGKLTSVSYQLFRIGGVTPLLKNDGHAFARWSAMQPSGVFS